MVVGDIIELENGDKIPADAEILNSIDLLVDESLMTGESVPVEKGADNTPSNWGNNGSDRFR